MIHMTDKLEKLREYAKHPTMWAEFWIQPTKKEILELNKDGSVKRSLWRYKVAGNPPVPRPVSTAMGAGWEPAGALPAADTKKSGGAKLPAAS